VFMKLFLDDFIVLINLEIHLPKLWLCLDKCKKFGISSNPKNACFWCI
jgi:hypothetical protein